MLTKLWAAVGAVVCGLIVTTLSGDATSAWSGIALPATLLAGALVTTAVALSRRRRMHVRLATIARVDAEGQNNDHGVLVTLVDASRGRSIEWLRRETFAIPWRHALFEALCDVKAFEAGWRRIADPLVAEAVERVGRSMEAFFEVYEADTIFDPVVRGAKWRMIGRDDQAEERGGLSEREWLAAQTRLTDCAADLCGDYDHLARLTMQLVPAERSTRAGGAVEGRSSGR